MNPQLRQTDREKIATATAEYLARGGVIEILPPWVAQAEKFGYKPQVGHKPAETNNKTVLDIGASSDNN